MAMAVFTAMVVNAQGPVSTPVPMMGAKILRGHVPESVRHLTALGRLPATNEIRLAIGVPLRDPAGLEQFLAEVYDPASSNYHHYLTPDELTARFGPAESDYLAVKDFARTNGFQITVEHPNRLLLDVLGRAADVERAFHLQLNKYHHPTEAREFFAPDVEPTVDAALPVSDIQGLSDFARPRPHFRKGPAANLAPRSGTAPDSSGDIFGNDFRNAYAAGTTNTGSGQMVGLVQFDGFYASDITSYAKAAGGGRTNIVIQTVLLDGYNGVPTTGANSGNGEVALDIEMSMAMAPGLSKIVVFEAGPSGLQNDVLNSMLTFSNSIKQLSCSWGWDSGPSATTDNIFKLIAAAGQSFFNASGDTDAFVAGSNNDVDNTNQVNAPSSCPYITQVGGTTLTMNGSGASFASETVWNDRTVNANGGNWGSSGGISTYYSIPSWQAATSMTANGGSTNKRNIPDVALTANNVYSTYDNGSAGSTGGTSCAAPLWAGFMALVNQQAVANGSPPVGFINPAVYALSHTADYTNCFHDTTTGDNSWSGSSGKFVAVAGYDLATGLGTPKGLNLINALAPLASTPPAITSSPQSQTNSLGATATFTVVAGGSPPLAYQWYFTNVISGATNPSLVLSNIVATSAGNYFVIVTNSFGSATSAVARLAVTLAPAITGFSPGYGVTDDPIVITGLLFTNVTSVAFNGVSASFTNDSPAQITAAVPAGAGSGPLSVTTVNGSAISANRFTVLAGNGAPVVASFTPASGLVNSSVTLTGTNFVAVSGVGFNGVNAAFTVDSISQITATVPAGATDGPLSVTNSYGVGVSAMAFTMATNPVSAVGISQVYGGGGNSGATYQNDYIELYNRSGSAVDLSGWSVQYASATGTSWSKANLSGTVPSGHYYLIQAHSGGGNGSTLPAADVVSTIDLSSSKGKVALLSTQTTIASGTSSPVGAPGLEDFVGYGNADAYEGSGPAPAISVTTADFRAGAGATDAGDNTADFSTGTPNPRNSSVGGVAAADLAISLTHTGNFTQGDPGDTYTITVANPGSLASTGTVTVVDALPAGLTATAIGGTGWSANLGKLTCTRTDALAAAASYSPIIVTVSVAANAAASVTNTATVSGGGDANAANNTATDPTTINPATVVSNQPPVVTTSPAGSVSTNTATLNGSLNPNGPSATAQFEYGLTTSYGTIVALPGVFTGSNTIVVSTNLSGLTAGRTYHFRLDATNAGGLTQGADQSFTTIGGSGGGSYGGVLAGWETTGLSGYGPSPFAATTNAPNTTVVGLTRGAGVGTAGSAGANAWGGTGFVYANEAAAVTGNSFVTFSVTANSGYTVSFTNLPAYNIRRSGTGSSTGIWQYQVGSGAFTDIGSAITWGTVTTSTGNPETAIDLSGIAALQNVPAGTGVTFRIVLWGGTGTGTWYVNNLTGNDLQVLGSLAPVNTGVAAPVITVPPVGTNVFIGKNAGFSVTATGDGTLNYQWLKGGVPFADGGVISGARANALNFTPAGTNHAGNYSVIVTNLGGSVTSSVAPLMVAPLPALVLSNAPGSLMLAADGGAVSSVYIIQRATNLTPPIIWSPVQTNLVGTNGQIRFTATNLNSSAGYYRIQIP